MNAFDKPQKGTAAYAKAKNDRNFAIGFTIVGFFVFCANYLFTCQLQQHMREASTAWNVVGVVFHVASIATLWIAPKLAGGTKIHPGILWLVFLALGILTSCGFEFGR